MVREFTDPAEAYGFYKKQRSATGRYHKGKWLVFSPSSAAIGRPSADVHISG